MGAEAPLQRSRVLSVIAQVRDSAAKLTRGH